MCSNGILILVFRNSFEKSNEIYSKLGQFQYRKSDFTPEPIQQLNFNTSEDGKAVYLGQLKEGTDIQEGIGIQVYSNGDIAEGYWRDCELNGKGSILIPFKHK